MNEQELAVLVQSVTPGCVRQLVLELEPQQPAPNRGTVPLYQLLEAFSVGLPLSDAAEGSRVEVLLRKAIIAAVKDVAGMTFIEGDG